MAHEIDFTTGKPAIAYTGEVPWHGFGMPMAENQPLEVWRELAGLNWSVEEKPIWFRKDDYVGGTYLQPIPKKKVLLRSDNQEPLAVVSNRFKTVQPEQIIDFFSTLIKKYGFKMSTAGSLKGGRRIWAMADCGKDFTIAGDKVGAHLLLATAYDGTFATTGQFTSIRTVCNNTLTYSLEKGGEGGIIKIPHTQDFNVYDVQAGLGLGDGWTEFRNNVTKLTEHRVTRREALDYFLAVMGVTEQEAADGKQLSNVKKLISFYDESPGAQLLSAKDTLWGCVNAVTYLADHGRRATNNGTRFDSAAFGSGAKMKTDAFKAALGIAEAA